MLSKRSKKQFQKEKNSIRVIGRVPEKEKKWPTGEFELFKKIADERKFYYAWSDSEWYVDAKHINQDWMLTRKVIKLENLTPTNFSHTIPKSRGEQYRLDPDNIEIVSRAYHEWHHTKQIPKLEYIN